MLHHVPRALARCLLHGEAQKVALLMIDRLALHQWLLLRTALARQSPTLRLHEGAVFAWLPTITTVSRQAAFAGRPPFYYPASIGTTAREGALWTAFWADQGVGPDQVLYLKGLGELTGLRAVEAALGHPRVRVAGLVVDTVDRALHGTALGTAGLYAQVRGWAHHGFLRRLLDLLLGAGFTVFLTSDHGNVEAEGGGRPVEGVMAATRGERVRVYADAATRARAQEQFPEAIAWPALGLPEDYLRLLAAARRAFITSGHRAVARGGACLEEVVVPFIRIEGASPACR